MLILVAYVEKEALITPGWYCYDLNTRANDRGSLLCYEWFDTSHPTKTVLNDLILNKEDLKIAKLSSPLKAV